MKICLIGPSYPFRGGIPHYTTLLYRTLKNKHEVKFFAFKRQYPHWLFPGRTDKDISHIAIREEGVERILDSMNPITWWRVFRKISAFGPQLLVLPWWVSFWTPQFWVLCSLVKALTNTKILFICHNVVEHEASLFDRTCTKIVLRKGDYFIVHSKEDLENLKEMLPEARVRQSFHPTYEAFNLERIPKEGARKNLRIEGNTLLFFGFVRPYKGLRVLIEAMPEILRRVDVNLLVIGEFWEDERTYRKQVEDLNIEDKVEMINAYVPNEKIGVYFSASDLVVLPYVSGTGSGILQLAFGFHKPVVVTKVGCLPEVVEDGKTGFVVDAQDPSALSEAIIAFYEGNREAEFVRNIVEESGRFSWDRMAETIEHFVPAQNDPITQ